MGELLVFASAMMAAVGMAWIVRGARGNPVEAYRTGRGTYDPLADAREVLGATASFFLRPFERWLGGVAAEVGRRLLVYAVLGAGSGLAAFAATGSPVLGLGAGAVFGVAVPQLFLWMGRRARLELFNRQLEDGLLRMASVLRAGGNLWRAISELGDMPDPIGREFRLAAMEIERAGVTPQRALEGIWRREPSREMRLVVIAARIADEVGSDLARNFEGIAGTIRQRVTTQAKVNAALAIPAAEAKALLGIALAVPALMAFFMPAFRAYWFASIARSVLFVLLNATSVLVYLFMRRMTRVEL